MKIYPVLLVWVLAAICCAATAHGYDGSLSAQLDKNHDIKEKFYTQKLHATAPSPLSRAECFELYERHSKIYAGALCKFTQKLDLERIGIFSGQGDDESGQTGEPAAEYTIASAWTAYPMRSVQTKVGNAYLAEVECDNSDSKIPRPIDRCYALLALQSSGGFYYGKFIRTRYRSSSPIFDEESVIKILESVARP